jgi:hypothetical protein
VVMYSNTCLILSARDQTIGLRIVRFWIVCFFQSTSIKRLVKIITSLCNLWLFYIAV